MNFHIITLFPEAFESYFKTSILKRAQEDKKIKIKFYNPRDYTKDPKSSQRASKNRRIDRKPYGGGPGMVIEALPVIKAVEAAIGRKLKTNDSRLKTKIVWLSPSGKQFTNTYADRAAKKYSDIVIICGRYEGIDARVKKVFKAEEVSVGPFVLTGGELPAMVMVDCIARRLPEVLGDESSVEELRTASPEVYTRPEVLEYKKKNYRVPKVLVSGHHEKIEAWKAKKSKK